MDNTNKRRPDDKSLNRRTAGHCLLCRGFFHRGKGEMYCSGAARALWPTCSMDYSTEINDNDYCDESLSISALLRHRREPRPARFIWPTVLAAQPLAFTPHCAGSMGRTCLGCPTTPTSTATGTECRRCADLPFTDLPSLGKDLEILSRTGNASAEVIIVAAYLSNHVSIENERLLYEELATRLRSNH